MEAQMGVKECSEVLGKLTCGDRLTKDEKAAVWAAQHHMAWMIYSLTPRDKIAIEMFRVFYQASKTKTDIESIWRLAYAAADMASKAR